MPRVPKRSALDPCSEEASKARRQAIRRLKNEKHNKAYFESEKGKLALKRGKEKAKLEARLKKEIRHAEKEVSNAEILQEPEFIMEALRDNLEKCQQAHAEFRSTIGAANAKKNDNMAEREIRSGIASGSTMGGGRAGGSESSMGEVESNIGVEDKEKEEGEEEELEVETRDGENSLSMKQH